MTLFQDMDLVLDLLRVQLPTQKEVRVWAAMRVALSAMAQVAGMRQVVALELCLQAAREMVRVEEEAAILLVAQGPLGQWLRGANLDRAGTKVGQAVLRDLKRREAKRVPHKPEKAESPVVAEFKATRAAKAKRGTSALAVAAKAKLAGWEAGPVKVGQVVVKPTTARPRKTSPARTSKRSR